MAIDARFEEALRTSDRLGELRKLATNLLESGNEANDVVALFEETRGQLRDEGREEDEDVVMEVMDFLTGWCSPHVKLPAEKNA